MSYQDTVNLIKNRKKLVEVSIKSTADNTEYKFQVRRLTPKEYAEITTGKSKDKLAEDVGINYILMEKVVCLCTVSPPIVNKESDKCAEHELSVNDLSLDIMQSLLYEIYILSGIIEKTEDEVKN